MADNSFGSRIATAFGRAFGRVKASVTGPAVARFQESFARWTKRDFVTLADEGYQKNAIVYRCVSLIASNAAAVPLKLEDRDGNEIERHPLLDLLRRPNPRARSAKAFLEGVYTFRLLAGESFVEAVGPSGSFQEPPRELYMLRPDRMRVVPGPNSVPSKFIHEVNNVEDEFEVEQLTGDSNILHSFDINPLDDWRGFSPILAAAYAIDQHNAAGSWNAAQLQNSGKPSLAVTYEAPKNEDRFLTEDERGQVQEQVEKELRGPGNAGRIAVLGTSLRITPLSRTAHEMDWLKGKQLSAKEIALTYHVPEQLVGVEGSQTFANYEQARLALYDDAVLPLAQGFIDELNTWLAPRFGDGLKLTLDLDKVDALAPRRKAVWERVKDADFMKLDEKREAVGLEPLEGGQGQVVFMPQNLQPVAETMLDDDADDEDLDGDRIDEEE